MWSVEVLLHLVAGTDVRWAVEVNLSISVESLKISDEVGGMVSSDYFGILLKG